MEVRVIGWGRQAYAGSRGDAPALRDHYTLHYVESGKGLLVMEGQAYTVGTGQGFVLWPGVEAAYEADAADPWVLRWIGYTGEDAGRLTLQAGLNGRAVFTAWPTEEFTGILRQAEEDIAAFPSWTQGEMCALGGLYRFLLKAGACRAVSPSTNQSAREQAYEKACRYLQAHFAHGVTIQETADFVGLSRSELFRVFKASVGRSPLKHLMALRLTQAGKLLRDTQLSVKEIAYACGFSSTAHLCSVFRDKCGCTPGDFRRGGLDV